MSVPDGLTDQERALAEAIAARSKPVGDAAALVEEIARIFAVTVEELGGGSRLARLVDARTVISYVLTSRGWTSYEVGALMNRNYVTVLNMLRRMDKDFDLRRLAKELAA